MCRRSGNLPRAEQLLRYALRLDPSSRKDLEEELVRLSSAEQAVPSGVSEPPSDSGSDDESEPGVWVIEEDSSSTLREALREAELAIDRRLNPVAAATEVIRAAVLSVEVSGAQSARAEAPVEVRAPEPRAPVETRPVETPRPEAAGEGAFIERGPTRADPSLDAWCSFCCRPRSEVGPLVAGPAGAFICSACIGESGALLGGVVPVASAVRRASASRKPVSFELVGRRRPASVLERGLEVGVRRVLLLGPEGTGKSTWMRALVEQGRGVLVTPDALDRAPVDAVLLVEDVDRLSPAEQASLAAFLARYSERTVVMTSRGKPVAPGPVLQSDSGLLPVLTTPSISEAVRGTPPLVLLEQVQLVVVFEALGVGDPAGDRPSPARLAGDCRLGRGAHRARHRGLAFTALRA